MSNIILAIVGLAGAGKTESTEYLMKKTGWPKVYFGQVVMDEVATRNLPVNEANERMVREELRAKHGMASMAILSIPKIKELYKTTNVILESLYSWEEYLAIKEEFAENFKVVAIYSSLPTRVERMKIRPVRPLTEADLISRDKSQIENLHQAGPIARADWTIINEGSKEGLYKNLDEIIGKLT
ncbi:MAG: AAA family ATPase [Candidatus Doudnabacteria bacterium]|jgi:dephospho-CoA kinase